MPSYLQFQILAVYCTIPVLITSYSPCWWRNYSHSRALEWLNTWHLMLDVLQSISHIYSQCRGGGHWMPYRATWGWHSGAEWTTRLCSIRIGRCPWLSEEDVTDLFELAKNWIPQFIIKWELCLVPLIKSVVWLEDLILGNKSGEGNLQLG